MKTKYGTVRINNKGYYQITSGKEGNHGKLLHRLVWEDFYGRPVPKGYNIHHIDGNPLNNEIWNLQCCERGKHMSFHTKGRKGKNNPYYSNPNNYHHSEESKQKISEARNTSGYFRVYKNKNKECKQGFIWCYQYFDNGKNKRIASVDIKKLEEKVKAKGLPWRKIKVNIG